VNGLNFKIHTFFGASLMTLASVAVADTPARPDYFYVVCSNQSSYCAAVSPADGIKLFKVTPQNKNIEATYSVPGWYPQVLVSDDGRRLVSVGATIVPDSTFNQPVVNCWVDGRLSKQYRVRDLVGRRKLTKTSSGLHWGEAIGFEGTDRFVFRLNDQSIVDIRF
jgi:hypothetical protein